MVQATHLMEYGEGHQVLEPAEGTVYHQENDRLLPAAPHRLP